MSASFIDSVDARTGLAGRNQLELLLFSLGDKPGRETEVFGINVFKVREVIRDPVTIRAPNMHPWVAGMSHLRGDFVPIINLAGFCGFEADEPLQYVIVTEYNSSTQGFLVHRVDSIVRLDWAQVRVPPRAISAHHTALITAVSQLPDNRSVMLLDVEKVLSEVDERFNDEEALAELEPIVTQTPLQVLFADDSAVARGQITRTLDQLNVAYTSAKNGQEAWEKLQQIAQEAERDAVPLQHRLGAILTDIEMPKMDGFVLTKRIKSDARFHDIPVIMHSSLSGTANESLGEKSGADAFVSKFDALELAGVLKFYLVAQRPRAMKQAVS